MNKLIKGYTDTLYEYLRQDEKFFFKCRELILAHYDQILISLQILSPGLSDLGISKLSFKCLHTTLADENCNYYPFYAIEYERFLKLIKQIECNIEPHQFINLATIINCYQNHPLHGPYIIYDKLFLALRNAVLTPREIQMITKLDISQDKAPEIENIPIVSDHKDSELKYLIKTYSLNSSNKPEEGCFNDSDICNKPEYELEGIKIISEHFEDKSWAIRQFVSKYKALDHSSPIVKVIEAKITDHDTPINVKNLKETSIKLGATDKITNISIRKTINIQNNDEEINFLSMTVSNGNTKTVYYCGAINFQENEISTIFENKDSFVTGFFGNMTNQLKSLGVYYKHLSDSQSLIENEKFTSARKQATEKICKSLLSFSLIQNNDNEQVSFDDNECLKDDGLRPQSIAIMWSKTTNSLDKMIIEYGLPKEEPSFTKTHVINKQSEENVTLTNYFFYMMICIIKRWNKQKLLLIITLL